MCRRTARPPPAATPGWSVFSPEPSVPVQELVAKEKRDQGHASQEDTKGHLVIAVDHLRRLPCPATEAVKIVRIVSLMPRNAPTMAINLTSPKPIPSVPRQRRYTAPAP